MATVFPQLNLTLDSPVPSLEKIRIVVAAVGRMIMRRMRISKDVQLQSHNRLLKIIIAFF
jgi:hypothetical protein